MDMFTELFMSLINGVYSVVNGAFQIFFDLASNEIISSNAFEDLISNFYLVIGIIMLFVLAFSLLRGMINPDDSKQGTSMVKKIVVNLVTSTVILAILPFVFTFAYDFQRAMLTYNPIGTFFGYGSNNGSSNEDEAEKGANTLVNSVYTAFLNVSDTKLKECEVNISECSNGMSTLCLQECQKDISNPEDSGKTFYDAIELAGTTGNFSVYKDFVSVINDKDSELSFNMLLQLIASLILLYIAVSFCFDMAVRAVKLIFYQIIAPVPVFLRIVPNSKVSGTFNEWIKITLTCYLEVYIRIFAVYFAIYLCNAFLAQNFFDNSGFIGFLTNAFVVMGIIMFMKQLPKLLGEVTGIKSDGMKLGLKDKFKDGGFFMAGAALGGGVTALTRNAINKGGVANNKWDNVRQKQGKDKVKALGSALWSTTAGIGGSMVGGFASGVMRAGKGASSAKSFGDMKNTALKGAKEAVDARDRRTTYKANHGYGDDQNIVVGNWNVLKGHVTDAIRTGKEWAEIGVVTSGEADYFTAGAKAFDGVHSQIEAAYKGKPGHDALKEQSTKYDAIVKRLEKQIDDIDGNLNKFKIEYNASELNHLENLTIPLSAEQIKRKEELINMKNYLLTKPAELESLKVQHATAEVDLKNIKAETSLHEAGEMKKKSDIPFEALNSMINAKIKYADIAKDIFEYNEGFDEQGNPKNNPLYNFLESNKESDAAKKIVDKISNNEIVNKDELFVNGEPTVSMNSLEKLLDDVSKLSKQIATKKRVEVSHAKAEKTENSGDKK